MPYGTEYCMGSVKLWELYEERRIADRIKLRFRPVLRFPTDEWRNGTFTHILPRLGHIYHKSFARSSNSELRSAAERFELGENCPHRASISWIKSPFSWKKKAMPSERQESNSARHPSIACELIKFLFTYLFCPSFLIR